MRKIDEMSRNGWYERLKDTDTGDRTPGSSECHCVDAKGIFTMSVALARFVGENTTNAASQNWKLELGGSILRKRRRNNEEELTLCRRQS